ncbi:MAG: monovalent cation/H+ antiporter subunit D family protein [Proteobacteria bacterium]|nr:monovalent cation/H+ antiporter subunit D family protein [Pseudomonadota bacterium]MDA1059495.1 monovalent cation/H+ antiporter subunit D family protein [Pseudomonadota bacterium]
MTPETLMVLTLAVPLAGAAVISLLDRSPNVREAATLLTAVVLFALNIALAADVLAGARPEFILADFIPGAPILLGAEPLGVIFGLVASGLWIVTSVYAIGYMRGKHEAKQTRFYTFFAIALTSTMGVAYSGNLISLFIFYEALSLSTYPLVTHHNNDEARKGGRTYLGVLLTTSIGFFLFGVLWVWHEAGTVAFTPGGVFSGQTDPVLIAALLALFVFGIGKAGVMPFHRWLPAAMVAPTPVSALLHAVAVVKAGVFSILKVTVYIFGVDFLAATPSTGFFLWVAAATILIASIIALRQDNLKRRLAYSTVGQLSYIVLAAMLANSAGIVGGALHIASHAFGKITLFFCAGAIYVAANKTTVSQLRGIGRSMPWTMTAFTIGAISIIGLPPTGGFVSKWYILLGVLQAEQPVMAGVLIVSTLLSAAYLLPVVYTAFFQAPEETGPPTHGEAPRPILLALGASVTLTFLMFFFSQPIVRFASQIVGGI